MTLTAGVDPQRVARRSAAELRADVEAIRALAPITASMSRLCSALTGHAPALAPRTISATWERHGVRGCLIPVAGAERVFVRRGLTLADAREAIAHELGHWWFRRVGHDETEADCDALGALLLAEGA